MENFINKIGLDRICHFGIGGVLFAGFTIAFALANLSIPLTVITWSGILLFPLSGYVIVAFVEFVKEFIIDGKPDIWDIVATFGGAIFVHLCAIFGYAISFVPSSGLIHSTTGWIVFGVIMVILAGAWIYWAIKSGKKKN